MIFWTLSGLFVWWLATPRRDNAVSTDSSAIAAFFANRPITSALIALAVIGAAYVGTLQSPNILLVYWATSQGDRCTRMPPIDRYLRGDCHGQKPAITRGNANAGTSDNCVLGTALSRGHHDIVREVFAKGGDWHLCAKSGVDLVKTWVIRCAQRENRTDDDNTIISLLMTQTGLTFADLKEPLLEATQYCPEAALYMLKHGTPPDEPPGRGITPLHRAVYKKEGDLQLVRALLEAGADVNARSSTGQTPLFLAKQWGRAEVVQLLLDYGAKI